MAPTTDANWLLDDFARRVAGVEHAVVLSADGLLLGRLPGLSREGGEHLAAVASAFHRLSRGTARHFQAGAVRQTLVEMDEAFLLVTAAGQGACLAALTGAQPDLGRVAYEMNRLVARVGGALSVAPRSAAGPGAGAAPS
jgi:predicted regulator of Ras-like GTPase activity (Roadblock/LC7/MglB family)